MIHFSIFLAHLNLEKKFLIWSLNTTSKLPTPNFDKSLYYFGIQLSTTVMINKREAYTLLDLSGDLGGVIEIFTIAFGILLSPFAEFLFNVKAIEKLYLAKTND